MKRKTGFLVSYLPLIVAVGFSIFTVLCYAFGPFRYYSPATGNLYLYLLLVHLAVVLGYYVGWLTARAPGPTKTSFSTLTRRLSWLYLSFAVLTVAGMVVFRMTPTAGLVDPIGARTDRAPQMAGTIFSWFGVLAQVVNISTVVLCFGYWDRVSTYFKVAGLSCVALVFAASVGGGNRAGVWLILTTAFSGVLLQVARQRSARALILWGGAVGSVIAAFALYSSFIAKERRASSLDSYQEFLLAQNEIPVDRDNWLLKVHLPDSLEASILQGVAYFGHGYHGLALCLDEDFQGIGWGVGNSTWLMRLVSRATRSEAAFESTCFFRMVNRGLLSSSHWVTAYPWVAADVTFAGSIIVMALIGWLLARSWHSALHEVHFFGAFCYAVMMVVFFHIYVTFPTGDLGALLYFHGSIGAYLLSVRLKKGTGAAALKKESTFNGRATAPKRRLHPV